MKERAMVNLVIKNVNILTSDAIESEYLVRGGVAVNNGKIVAIAEEELLPEAEKTIDGKGNLLLPGTIDTHVHLRDPGHAERETFKTGTMAAAAGGVTTILEMPISVPPPYSPELIENRKKIAESQVLVDFCLFGAAGANKIEHIQSCSEAGIVGFKTFFHQAPEGREEEFDGLTMENAGLQFKGLKEVSKTGKLIAVHCENNDMVQEGIKELKAKGKIDPEAHALSRPPICETETVSKVLLFARETGLKVDFVHISNPEAMELIKQGKKEGMDIYLETCPQYLFLTTEDLKKHGAYAKCNPPLREQKVRDALWKYIEDGTVDFIGSDHSPYLDEEKRKGLEDIFKAPAGFPGIEQRLPLLLTAVKEKKLSLYRAIELLAINPAKTFGLYPKKGVIRVGSDADFVLVNMEKEFVVDNKKMFTHAKEIARVFNQWKLVGQPELTIVRGKIVFQDGQITSDAPGWGQFVPGK